MCTRTHYYYYDEYWPSYGYANGFLLCIFLLCCSSISLLCCVLYYRIYILYYILYYSVYIVQGSAQACPGARAAHEPAPHSRPCVI